MDSKTKLFHEILSKDLVRKCALSDLHSSVAIDSEYWLKTHLSSDPYSRLLGGLPLSLERATTEFISDLKRFGLKPIFVFPGLSLNFPSSSNLSKKAQMRAQIWDFYAKGQWQALENELKKGQILPWESYGDWSRIIRRNGGQVLRAPYLQGSQLAYLALNNLVGGIYADIDALIFGPNSDDLRVIVEIDIAEGTFKHVQRVEVLQALDISYSSLVDYFAMTGYLFGRPLVSSGFSIFDMKKPDFRPQDQETFERIRAIILSNVAISAYDKNIVYDNVQTVIELLGPRFPKKLYFAMCVFPLSSQTISTLASRKLVEIPPHAFSDYYRYALSRLKPIRNTTFSLLLAGMDARYGAERIEIQYWFKDQAQDTVTVSPVNSFKWIFSEAELSQEIERQGIVVGPKFCLAWHFSEYEKMSGLISKLTSDEPQPVLSSADMILAKVIFRFLEFKEYISKEKKPTLFGKSLIDASDNFELPLFYVLEFFRHGLLNERTLSQKNYKFLNPELFNQLGSFPTANQEKRYFILLISRFFSLIHPKLKAESWTGEIDYDLIQFHYIVKLFSTSCQSLIESILVNEFLSGRIPYNTEAITAVNSIPFQCHPHIGLGIAVKLLLRGFSLSEVKSKLPQMDDLEDDLMKGWNFWLQVVKMVKYFDRNKAFANNGNPDIYLRASSVLQAAYRRAGFQLP